jgi:POT family proton-dependent oligopeptide transporter
MIAQTREGHLGEDFMDIIFIVGIVITLVTGFPVILQLRQQPKGLHIIFFTEMWERFSYYGMRTILFVYMTQHFLFSDEAASGQYGAYTSLVYLLPLIGGMLADRYLGTTKAVAFGALLLVAGHLTMAIEQEPARNVLVYEGQRYDIAAEGRQDKREAWLVVDGQRYEFGPAAGGGMEIKGYAGSPTLPAVIPADDPETTAVEGYQMIVEGQQPFYMSAFFLALSLIIMGVGFLKANLATQVGQLYTKDDPRRDGGFSLYYYGINLGAFWAQVGCAWLGAELGWAWGFGAAGVGMLLGWLVFVRRRILFFLPGPAQLPAELGLPPNPEQLKKPLFGPINREWLIYIVALLSVGLVWLLVQREPIVNTALTIASVAMLAFFIHYMVTKATRAETGKLILAIILVMASVVFFTLFELAGSALSQFSERSSQLCIAGSCVTSGQTQSFNGAFILIFAPIFAAMWTWLGRHKRDPGDAFKFALGLIQVGAGFLVLVWGIQYADAEFKVPLIFLILLYLLHTTGELFLSPVGLSAMTKLTPAPIAATMMATWYLGSSIAQAVQAQITKLTAQETIGGQVLDPGLALKTYGEVFTNVGLAGIGIGIALGIASPFLNRLARMGEPAHAPADRPMRDATAESNLTSHD